MEIWDSYNDYASGILANKNLKKHRESCAKAKSKRKSKRKNK